MHVHQDQRILLADDPLQGRQPVFSSINRQLDVAEDVAGDLTVDLVILNQQHRGAAEFPHQHRISRFTGNSSAGSFRGRPLAKTGRQPEGAAGPRAALNPGLAPHQLRQPAGQGQTKPGAAVGPAGGPVGLLKL